MTISPDIFPSELLRSEDEVSDLLLSLDVNKSIGLMPHLIYERWILVMLSKAHLVTNLLLHALLVLKADRQQCSNSAGLTHWHGHGDDHLPCMQSAPTSKTMFLSL